MYFKSVTGMSDRHHCMHIISNHTDGVCTPKTIYFIYIPVPFYFYFSSISGKKKRYCDFIAKTTAASNCNGMQLYAVY